MRRTATLLGASLLVTALLPGAAAHAKSGDALDCKKVLKTSAKLGVSDARPFVVYQYSEDGGDYNAVWFGSTMPQALNELTSCTFHDTNRNRKYDARTEPVFDDRQSFENPYDTGGRWPYGMVFTGVAEGEQVCNGTTMRSTPLSGAEATTSSTGLTCFPVEDWFSGA